MERATVNRGGQITIPHRVRRQLNLRAGEVVEIDASENGVILRRYDPQHDPDDFEYHATFAPKGPSGSEYMTAEEFLAWLDSTIDLPVAVDESGEDADL